MTTPTTNITEQDKESMEAIENPRLQKALFSAFYDGKPCTVLVIVTQDAKDYTITPVAIMLTEEMASKLTDHDGQTPEAP